MSSTDKQLDSNPNDQAVQVPTAFKGLLSEWLPATQSKLMALGAQWSEAAAVTAAPEL